VKKYLKTRYYIITSLQPSFSDEINVHFNLGPSRRNRLYLTIERCCSMLKIFWNRNSKEKGWRVKKKNEYTTLRMTLMDDIIDRKIYDWWQGWKKPIFLQLDSFLSVFHIFRNFYHFLLCPSNLKGSTCFLLFYFVKFQKSFNPPFPFLLLVVESFAVWPRSLFLVQQLSWQQQKKRKKEISLSPHMTMIFLLWNKQEKKHKRWRQEEINKERWILFFVMRLQRNKRCIFM